MLKKVFLCMAVCALWHTSVHGATSEEWDGTNPITSTYHIDSVVTLTEDLFIESGGVLTIRNDGTLNTNSYNIHNNGSMGIFSAQTLNIDNSTLNNFDEIVIADGGVLNINFGGALINFSGHIDTNGEGGVDDDGLLTVNSGGSLYNYYGTIDSSHVEGYDPTLVVKAGGKYHSVGVAEPYPVEVENGGTFLVSHEAHLDRNIVLEYPWELNSLGGTANSTSRECEEDCPRYVVNGNGHTVTLGEGGGISLLDELTLHLEDVIIHGVQGGNIECYTDYGTLSLNNVVWHLIDDFSWEDGAISVLGYWRLEGVGEEYIFSYRSSEPCSIASNATMHLFSVAFAYQITPSDRFQMANATSTLHLENAAFIARPSCPCALTKGTLLTTNAAALWGYSTLWLTGLAEIQTHGSMIKIRDVVI